jgi:hypothetical protein
MKSSQLPPGHVSIFIVPRQDVSGIAPLIATLYAIAVRDLTDYARFQSASLLSHIFEV